MSVLTQIAESLGLADATAARPKAPDQRRCYDSPTLVEMTTKKVTHHYLTAATAASEWVRVRDQYVEHLMGCRACYAPTDRYCNNGRALRQRYRSTPMNQE